MFIPVGTDAPLYHRPWITISIIVANVAAMSRVGFVSDSVNTVTGWDGWALEYGNELHPLQWITVHFVHFGLMHLVGNMIFLWTFGMVVEGKIGWWRFLLLYLGIGVLGGFLTQLVMLNYDGFVQGAGGASLMVFALIGIAMVWAPENEVDMVFVFFYGRVMKNLEVRIYVLASLYIGIQLYSWWNQSSSLGVSYATVMSSEAAHLLGAFLGFGIGVIMLKKEWVDCENWDLFSVWRGDHRKSVEFQPYYYRNAAFMPGASFEEDTLGAGSLDEKMIEREADPGKKTAQVTRVVERIQYFLEAGELQTAFSAYEALKQKYPEQALDESVLKSLANGLYKSQAWSDVLPVMEDYIQHFSGHAHSIRVKLAGVLVEIKHRPRYALRLLSDIPDNKLNECFKRERTKIERVAQRKIEEGVLELESRPTY